MFDSTTELYFSSRPFRSRGARATFQSFTCKTNIETRQTVAIETNRSESRSKTQQTAQFNNKCANEMSAATSIISISGQRICGNATFSTCTGDGGEHSVDVNVLPYEIICLTFARRFSFSLPRSFAALCARHGGLALDATHTVIECTSITRKNQLFFSSAFLIKLLLQCSAACLLLSLFINTHVTFDKFPATLKFTSHAFVCRRTDGDSGGNNRRRDFVGKGRFAERESRFLPTELSRASP